MTKQNTYEAIKLNKLKNGIHFMVASFFWHFVGATAAEWYPQIVRYVRIKHTHTYWTLIVFDSVDEHEPSIFIKLRAYILERI